ncbi:MAG TPA: BlaI/MecI/CopY family transcriptional regulator [Bryobacteraceae bacterium]|jgi:predicted transcriptional regulator|nr:BlaI/MecI/CopY family transcriptional regulator [Bryobacteraceae bacterium]
MKKSEPAKTSRRERQILDILYRTGEATAAEVREALTDPPSYSAVRATLRILEEKGHVRHQARDLRYVFMPAVPREQAKRSALRHLLETFFDRSAEQMVATLLDGSAASLTGRELDRISDLIQQARKKRGPQ